MSLVDGFANAALADESWTDALAAMAAACGFRSGELVGFGVRADLTFNFMSGFPAEGIEEFAAIGGGDPDVNPRVRAAANAPLMRSFAEADFLVPEDLQAHPFYSGFCRKYDIPFGCMMPLVRDGESFVGLAMFRGAGSGHASDAERALFESIAPHVRTAVRTQAALERQGGFVISGALDAMSIAAFVCDRAGSVVAMTEGAEAHVRAGVLRVRQGRLGTPDPASDRPLRDAVRRVALKQSLPRSEGPSAALVVHDRAGRPIALDVLPLPRREGALGFEPRALIVVRECRRDQASCLALLQAAYHLTVAEAQVAMLLAEGEAPEAIARRRGVATSTVRVQIRALYLKLGVRRQSELVARLNHLV